MSGSRLVGALALAVTLTFGLAPLAARAADLVVWWEKGFYPAEDQSVRELVTEFEQKTGKKVELAFVPQWELEGKIEAALAAGWPPDVARVSTSSVRTDKLAASDVLVDLSDVVLPIKSRFFPDLLDYTSLPNPHTGQPTLYTAPMGQGGFYIHIWKSLLEQAGFTLADIPQQWDSFWSFWCDRVQPAARRAIGRQDIWGLGLPMTTTGSDTFEGIQQFLIAHSAYIWTNDRTLLLSDPVIRENFIDALANYTAPWGKGCVPPDVVTWGNPDNNKAFLEQRIIMVTNTSLSIPAALHASRPDDYYKNTVTIHWPVGPDQRIYPVIFLLAEAVIFRQGQNVETAKDFLRFLLDEKQLGTWIEAQGRYLPTMLELAGREFWVDPSDPHRLTAVEQLASPRIPVWGPIRMWRPGWDKIGQERVFERAVHRIVADGLTPEQSADEAIARIKQILSEQAGRP